MFSTIPFFTIGSFPVEIEPSNILYITSHYYVANDAADTPRSTEYYYNPIIDANVANMLFTTSYYYVANEDAETTFSTNNYYNPIIE